MILLPVLLFALVSSLAAYFACPIVLPQVKSLSIRFSPRQVDVGFYAAIVVYALTFSSLSILRFLTFSQDGYDLSIFDQVIWNSLHGRLFENTILPDAPLLIGQRFSPILLAFVPMYAVWSSPIVLMVVQTLAIAFGALPLYWLARARIGRLGAWVIGLAFLLYPSVEFVNLDEFHEIALAVPLLSLATFFLLRGKYFPFLTTLGVTLLIKEEMAFIVIAFGIYICLIPRRWRLGWGLVLFGVLWSIALLQYILPWLNGSGFGTGYYYFGHGTAAGMGRYDYLGNSLLQVITSIITRPDLVIQHVVIAPKIDFMLNLLAPIAFLPLVGLEIALLALPTFGTSLLSDYELQFSIESHYTASLIPFLFFALVMGWQRIATWRLHGRRPEMQRAARTLALAVLVLIASGGSYYLQSPAPFAIHFDTAQYALTDHTAAGYSLLGLIPRSAAVEAQRGMVPHLSERREILEFPSQDYCRVDYLLGDRTRYAYTLFQNQWDSWFSSGYFEIVKAEDGFFLAQRRANFRPVGIRYGGQIDLLRFAGGSSPLSRGGQPWCALLDWKAEHSIRERYIIRVHVQDEHGHVFAQGDGEPNHGAFPTNQWLPNQSITDPHTLQLPPTMPSGVYQITVSVYDPASGRLLEPRDASERLLDLEPVVGTMRVEKDTSSFTASQLFIEQPFFVDMHEVRLMGYTAFPKAIAAGETLSIGIYWRPRGKPQGDYQVGVQLSNTNGRVVSEQVGRPANGAYPTTMWQVGEVLLDWHDLALPPQLPPGEYSLTIIMLDSNDQRLIGQASAGTITVER